MDLGTQKRLYEFIGRRIRHFREEADLKQGELAARVQLSRASITNIELGRQRLSIHQAYQLAEALNVDASEIFPPKAAINCSATRPAVSIRGLSSKANLWVSRVISGS